MDENHCPPYRHTSTSNPSSRAPDVPQDGNSYNPRPGTANSNRSPTLTATNIWAPTKQPEPTATYPSGDAAWLTDAPFTPPGPPSLLTSEPLSRSSVSPSLPSTSAFPSQLPLQPSDQTLLHPSDQMKRKRDRSSSLPSIPTYPKRQKTQAPFPSVLQNPNTSTLPTRIPNQILIASRTPPINTASLRSLDASEILKLPQLRHDLLFDALAFRPVCPPTAPADPAGKPNNIVSDMYWESVGVELTTGCRCVRWVVLGEGRVVDGQRNLAGKKRVEGCICGGWGLNLPEDDWWKYQTGRWASRLPEMIKTLREILLSLMGSTTPCADHFAHSFSREALEAHERTCPTIGHALVPELYQALEPRFLTAQIRRGVLGVGLFQMLGEAMKVHCAPVRDAMVDEMVATALRGEVTSGLKKCFDCVEVMKLDIANHQVHALRPYLWTNAVPHELNAFHQTLFTQRLTLSTSQTQKFIRNASLSILSSTAPARRTRLSTIFRPELVARSLAKGFIDLVALPWVSGSSWPPIPPRRMSGSAGVQFAAIPIPESMTLPETLTMDARRIKNFNAEFIELSIVHSVLVQVRGLVLRKDGWETGRVLESVKADLMDNIGGNGRLRIDGVVEGGVSDLGIRIAGRIVKPRMRNGGNEEVRRYSKNELQELQRVAQRVDSVVREAVGGIRGIELGMKSVQESLERVLGDLLVNDQSSKPTRRIPPVEADGMDIESESPLPTPKSDIESQDNMFRRLGMITGDQGSEAGGVVPEVKDLAKKMERIVGFNLKCFGEIYGMKGMVAGR